VLGACDAESISHRDRSHGLTLANTDGVSRMEAVWARMDP
jgi:hypothetical protein